MFVVKIILLVFAGLALIDRIFGSPVGIGRDFEKGIEMAGTLIIAMGGMLVLVPTLTVPLSGLAAMSSEYFAFSLIPSLLLANDLGGTDL